jgi:chemotaxis signal transduction protein
VNSTESRLQTKVSEMRQLFDESFAAPEQINKRAVEHLLAITVGGEQFAVRVGDISGLTITKSTILPVPSSVPELLGITGVHGVVVPVFSLAALLGIAQGTGQYRWLLLCGGRQAMIALAVELVEGHLEVPADMILGRATDAAMHNIKATVRDGAILRGVIDVALIVEQIKAKGRSS